MQTMTTDLLTARQVQEMFRVDKSTVYRMAGDGRLPAIKVGKQWRFPADAIEEIVGSRVEPLPGGMTVDVGPAEAVIDVMAERLGVMMMVADLEGHPLTRISNPCEWFREHADDPDVIRRCAEEWKALGDDIDLSPRLQRGQFGFECARAFIRHDASLVGMVLAGGIAPRGIDSPVLHRLDEAGRTRLLETLPMVAALIGRCALTSTDELNDARSTT